MAQPNMNQLLKQAQQMQAEMARAQEELKSEIVEASAGGGMVSIKLTGDMEFKEIKIDPAAIDPADPELLQDMVLAAVNEAVRAVNARAQQKMGPIAGGLNLPGM